MATYRCWAQSGVTQRANSTVYATGARMQPSISDVSTNHAVAKRYVWECTSGGGGSSGASVPVWAASYTPDVSTITDGAITWTCRNPGYSSGSTVDWTFASIFASYTSTLLAASDLLLVHYTSQEPANSSAHTWAPTTNNCSIISVDKDNSEVYTPMGTSGYLGNWSGGVVGSLSPSAVKLRADGLTLRYTGTGVGNLRVLSVDDGQLQAKDLRLELTANNSAPTINIGGAGDARSWLSVTGLVISRAHASQQCLLSGNGEILGLTLAGAGAVTSCFHTSSTADSTGTRWLIYSADLTAASSSATLVTDNGVLPGQIEFYDSILPSSYAVIAGAGNVNLSGLQVLIINGKAGSTTGIHAYANALGSAIRNTSITYNGEPFSWKIDASSLATRACPFVLPWMWGEIATGASVTPKIEILRDGSTTALTDAQVWCERGAAVTAGSPIKTFVSTEGAYTSSGTNIPTGAGLGSWAGESGTAWSGKLEPPACTPEGDELQMRICAATTTTFYAAQGWDT